VENQKVIGSKRFQAKVGGKAIFQPPRRMTSVFRSFDFLRWLVGRFTD
jgi:hypothetical protein